MTNKTKSKSPAQLEAYRLRYIKGLAKPLLLHCVVDDDDVVTLRFSLDHPAGFALEEQARARGEDLKRTLEGALREASPTAMRAKGPFTCVDREGGGAKFLCDPSHPLMVALEAAANEAGLPMERLFRDIVRSGIISDYAAMTGKTRSDAKRVLRAA
jgi:hypothetical protein